MVAKEGRNLAGYRSNMRKDCFHSGRYNLRIQRRSLNHNDFPSTYLPPRLEMLVGSGTAIMNAKWRMAGYDSISYLILTRIEKSAEIIRQTSIAIGRFFNRK